MTTISYSSPGAFLGPSLDARFWPGHSHDWVTHHTITRDDLWRGSPEYGDAIPTPSTLAACVLLAAMFRRMR